jgi:hypothetical protein
MKLENVMTEKTLNDLFYDTLKELLAKRSKNELSVAIIFV